MRINEMPGWRIGARSAGRARRLRSAVVKSAVLGVLGVPAVALLMSAGVASAATTQPIARPATASSVTWHHLSLLNGWHASSAYGVPSYAISGGVVYLTGVLNQPTPGNGEFAVLPKAARPPHAMYLSVSGAGGVEVTLIIFHSGAMEMSNPTAQSQIFSSLSGVSYPVAGTTWHPLKLINGWKSAANTGANSGDPAYAIKNGIVYLSGSVWQPSGSNATFALLPKAAVAGRKMFLTDFMANDTRGELTFGTNGTIVALAVSASQSQAQGFTSLAAISYPVAGTKWHNLTLINGWSTWSSVTGSAAYVIKNGIVYLKGAIQETSGNNAIFANMPSAGRPVHALVIPTLTNGGTSGYLVVGGHPRMEANGNPISNAQAFTGLSAISFPVNS